MYSANNLLFKIKQKRLGQCKRDPMYNRDIRTASLIPF